MDLRAFFLSILVFHFGTASYLIKRIRLRRVLLSSSNCEKGFYFDPNLEANGRCQPCSEICGVNRNIGDEGDCERHKDQCEALLDKTTDLSEEPVFTSDSPIPPKSSDSVIVITVTVTSILLAVLMTTILVCFIVRNCRRHSGDNDDDDTEARITSPRLIKSVESNPLRESKDIICITNVNKEPLEPHQMALLQSYDGKEFLSLDHSETFHNGITCCEHSDQHEARSVQSSDRSI